MERRTVELELRKRGEVMNHYQIQSIKSVPLIIIGYCRQLQIPNCSGGGCGDQGGI